jgi:4-diphosphocytidyl-2-C-methyl-D-erythritol kinase
MLKILAPAKVNLCLEILHKRDDGFHEIDTVMQAVSLFDELTLEPQDGAITVDSPADLGPIEDNLVYRAARLLADHHAPGRGARIVLTKRIPHGAGLGGGSSDAANTVVALNRLWGLGLSAARLAELVAEVGSDCAFFVEGGISRCTGRGEIVTPLDDLPRMEFVLLYPDAVCPTGQVYSELSRHLTKDPDPCYLVHEAQGGLDLHEFAGRMRNRLEQPALAVSEKLRAAWDATGNEAGVVKRMVSGSGSTILFLAGSGTEAAALAQALNNRGLGQVFHVHSLPRGTTWG